MKQENTAIFLSAGEASGDHYGAQIVREILARRPGTSFFGLGGREMEEAGQERIVRAEDVAHMGITEVVRHAPRVYASYRSLVSSIKQRRPQAAVLIDFPDVNLRLARELKALGIPVIYFVSPQLWAWKRRRLQWIQERVDRMMVIFPFEEDFYRARGVDATFTGHPLSELPVPTISREEYARREGHLDLRLPWIALLPGSRWREIEANLPRMVEAAAELGKGYELLIPLASTIAWDQLNEFVSSKTVWQKTGPIHIVSDAREALRHARASVVASGTATVQAALIGNPFVVVYNVSALTFGLAKKLVRYSPEVWPEGSTDKHGNLPIAMVNLIAGQRVVPELLQQNFTPGNVAAALRSLLDDTPERMQMIEDLSSVRERLQSRSGASPIAQVADAVEALLHEGAKV
ncbi:MAG: lipid-A-disaccharide synthase [Edaphobacter sp.]|uniref:lipid-A-disaccharide synthase n=1 Tax=Edaphobacter sp. TaxID=1934404 RepID=UPI00238E1BB0|nr:lipid-A-disaccharide synthase [Edaphobacter sp.]MDE1175511.1 lipid-A-disaccharide synthase [Edaphobacter sp.]